MPKILSVTEFRNNIAAELENVASNKRSHLVIKRPKGRGNIVVISEEAYSSMEETFYLLSNDINRENLLAGINELNQGKGRKVKLNKLWK